MILSTITNVSKKRKLNLTVERVSLMPNSNQLMKLSQKAGFTLYFCSAYLSLRRQRYIIQVTQARTGSSLLLKITG